MTHTFYNKRISSILTVLPKKIVKFADEVTEYPFPETQSLKLAKVMGYNSRRVCEPDDSVSDYAFQGIEYLINVSKTIQKKDIGAIVVVSSSQDFIIPYISYIIQGKLNLSNDVLCFDINQACGGYIMGLVESFMLLDTYNLKKILLITGDLLSKKVGIRDRSSRPIIGDAVNISIIEPSTKPNKIVASIKNFGQSASIIEIPAGGLKTLPSNETKIAYKDEFGNYRSKEDFYMDGEEVFNFVMREVPPIIRDIMKDSDTTMEQIDYYLFHQPNRYMVQKLADEMDIPYEKMFSNIVGIYGNSSTGTIPLNFCHNIHNETLEKDLNICMSGFGAGLICNAMVMNLEKMDVCTVIEYEKRANT